MFNLAIKLGHQNRYPLAAFWKSLGNVQHVYLFDPEPMTKKLDPVEKSGFIMLDSISEDQKAPESFQDKTLALQLHGTRSFKSCVGVNISRQRLHDIKLKNAVIRRADAAVEEEISDFAAHSLSLDQ